LESRRRLVNAISSVAPLRYSTTLERCILMHSDAAVVAGKGFLAARSGSRGRAIHAPIPQLIQDPRIFGQSFYCKQLMSR